MDRQIYAVLVGINDYNDFPLQGCLNDIGAVETMLKDLYNANGNLHIKRVADTEDDYQPTRDNVIAAFDFFNQANDGDFCLFYFCGHGANVTAPPVFVTDTGSQAVQVIVCKDWKTGVAGKGYIIDKELSFLIWKATYSKPNLNFVVITDCCHSGTATRSIEDDLGIIARQMEIMENSPSVESYLGFDYSYNEEPAYIVEKDATGSITSVSVKSGNHIHIAAAMDKELANELKVNGDERRGAFSYVLVNLLRDTNGSVSYRQLVDFSYSKLKNLYFNSTKPVQNPRLNILNLPVEHINLAFLSTEVIDAGKSFTVYYDKEFGWCISAGILLNVAAGDSVVVMATGDSVIKFTVQRAALQYAVISPADNTDISAAMPLNQRFKGFITGILKKALPVSFDESVSPAVKQFILDEQYKAAGLVNETVSFPGVRLIEDNTVTPAAKYTIAENDDSGFTKVFLRTTTGEVALPPVPAQSLAFLSNVDAVAKWQNIVNLANPNAILDEDDYAIDFKCAVGYDAAGYSFSAGDAAGGENVLQYFDSDDGLQNPAFRFAVTNKSSSSLFISFAYLDAAFGITTGGDGGFDDMQVEPGMIQKLLFGDYKSKNVLLANESGKKITEYLKIFISPVNVIPLYVLQQIPPGKDNTRAIAAQANIENWQVVTLKFTINPKPGATL
ncbi:MAG TPA: caspase family protein [Chitinophagaceae bacterium]|nr:caspase family protein [Chitinophagaceae bacterium]